MKILLISSNKLNTPYPVYPLGLDYVSGVIADKHDVKIIDLNTFDNNSKLIKTVKEFIPDIIGVSLRNIDNTDSSNPKGFIEDYHTLISLLKSCSNAIIVLGGCGFTIFYKEIFNQLKADFGIIGEGERFSLLVNAIEKIMVAEKIKTIEELKFRDENSNAQSESSNFHIDIPGVISKNCHGNIPTPLKDISKRDFNKNFNHVNYYLNKGGMLNLQTKRGCNFRCIYCTYPYIEGKKLRLIPPKEVAKMALSLQEAGARYLFITDSAFNCDIDHSIEVAKEFKETGLSTPWGAFFAPVSPLSKLYPRLSSSDYFKIMADAGLTHVEFGTESMSNTVLSAYRKPFKVKDIFIAHKAAIHANLHVAHYFLSGGPGETEATLKETLININSLEKTALFFFCGMRIYPNTELYDIAIREKCILKSQNLLKPVFYKGKINLKKIISMVENAKQERVNWIIGSGGDKVSEIITEMYNRGFTGPLWEYLIR